jgi:outer membrane protein
MTSKLLRFAFATCVLSLTAFAQGNAQTASAATPAPAPSTPSPSTPTAVSGVRIGIINMQQAIFASNEGRRDFDALTKKFEPKQGELKNMNDEVESLKKQLNTQGEKLNEESRSGLVKTIESKQKSLQRSLEDAQSDFQAQQNEVLNRVGAKMMNVLDKYAKDNGYALILDVSNQNSPVLWAGASTDVTKAIVDDYNTTSGVPAPAASTPSAPSATRSTVPRVNTARPATKTTPGTTPTTPPKQ